MRVTIYYMAQLKRAAGTASETVEVAGACTLADMLLRLAGEHGEAFGRMVLEGGGTPQSSLLLFVGEEQARGDRTLRDGDKVTLLTPMAGG